jgi:hypothetical protein
VTSPEARGAVGARVTYPQAGAAQRAACRRANETPDLRVSDWRVLCAVFGLTTSYSRLRDAVSVALLVVASGLSERQVRRSLARLREAGVVVHVPGRGRGRLTVVGVPEADGKAATPSAAFPGDKGGQHGRLAGDEKRTGSAPKSGQGGTGKADERARASFREVVTEKKTEKTSSTTISLPEELTRLLEGRFDLRLSQRCQVLAAYHEDRDGLARCVWTAISGYRPTGLLMSMIQSGEYREPGEDTFEEIADLLAMIDGRDPEPAPIEAEAETPPTRDAERVTTVDDLDADAWEDYLRSNHGDVYGRSDAGETL